MFSESLENLKNRVLEAVQPLFLEIDKISEQNTLKILNVMRECRVSEAHFTPTTGYAYDDFGRQKVEEVYSKVFQGEKALVRSHFASGTHTLSTVLFGILRPNDELISVTGKPYDTMQTVLGYERETRGSLKDFGVLYQEVPMLDGKINYQAIQDTVTDKTKMVLIQRSRGYSMRMPLSIAEIRKICQIVKDKNPHCICFVDNCYGEFVETKEPISAGADIIAGSLIKNPGGGLAPTGGYIVGRKDLVELASYRLTAPGIGSEIGASLVGQRLVFEGLFLAPHVVAQALKGAIFAAELFSRLGYKVSPRASAVRHDIIQAVELETKEKLIAFCRGIQKYSPVDAFATPTPWDMPGYKDQVIMAAGTFVQGSSIELSADGPVRPPYRVYFQGGLTFEHAMLGIIGAVEEVLNVST